MVVGGKWVCRRWLQWAGVDLLTTVAQSRGAALDNHTVLAPGNCVRLRRLKTRGQARPPSSR